jgi:hypothetical protein
MSNLKPSQKKTLATVKASARSLALVDNTTSRANFRALVALCAAEEKAHRGLMSSFREYHPFAPSVADTALFFAAHRIGQYLVGDKLPNVADYLHLQKSAFQAAAMVAEHADFLYTQLAKVGIPPAQLAALDYSTFVSPEEVAA